MPRMWIEPNYFASGFTFFKKGQKLTVKTKNKKGNNYTLKFEVVASTRETPKEHSYSTTKVKACHPVNKLNGKEYFYLHHFCDEPTFSINETTSYRPFDNKNVTVAVEKVTNPKG